MHAVQPQPQLPQQEPLPGQEATPQGGTPVAQSTPQAQVPPLSISLTRPPASLPPEFAQDYEADQIIGEGAYASVRRLRHRLTGEPAALKVVEKQPLAIRNMLPQLQREVRVHGGLRHPRILRLLTCVEDEYYVFMLLEYCAGGSLRELSARLPGARHPEGSAANHFAQILQGVDFIHQCSCVHRDLKPDNILLTHTGEVRICDFGWSAEVQIEHALRTTCGTPNYWAPEMYEGLPQNMPVDLWALGNMIYELLVGHPPFWGNAEELRTKITSVDLRYPPGLLSPDVINLFHCLLQRDPLARIPAGRLLAEHGWVRAGLASAPALTGSADAPVVPEWKTCEAPPQPAFSPAVAAAVAALPRAEVVAADTVGADADCTSTAASVIAWTWPRLEEARYRQIAILRVPGTVALAVPAGDAAVQLPEGLQIAWPVDVPAPEEPAIAQVSFGQPELLPAATEDASPIPQWLAPARISAIEGSGQSGEANPSLGIASDGKRRRDGDLADIDLNAEKASGEHA